LKSNSATKGLRTARKETTGCLPFSVQENSNLQLQFAEVEVISAITITQTAVSGSVTMAWCIQRLWMEVTASNLEGSCEYTEKAVADSQQGVVLQLRG